MHCDAGVDLVAEHFVDAPLVFDQA